MKTITEDFESMPLNIIKNASGGEQPLTCPSEAQGMQRPRAAANTRQ